MPPQACPAGYAARAFIQTVGDNPRKKKLTAKVADKQQSSKKKTARMRLTEVKTIIKNNISELPNRELNF